MKTILIKTHDEEWGELLLNRIDKELSPIIEEMDTVNHEYLIEIKIGELPE